MRREPTGRTRLVGPLVMAVEQAAPDATYVLLQGLADGHVG